MSDWPRLLVVADRFLMGSGHLILHPDFPLRQSEGAPFAAALRIVRPDGSVLRKLGQFGPTHLNIRGSAPLDARWRLVLHVRAAKADVPVGSEVLCRAETLRRVTGRSA